MPQVIGQRTTYQASSGQENRLPRHIDENIAYLEPNVAPTITMLMKLKKRQGINSPVHEWLESDYTVLWAQNGTATIANNAASTTITVTDGTMFVAGDQFIVPKAATSSTPPEVIRVTAVSSNTLTVVRGIGGAGTIDTIAANAALRITGSAAEEGSTLPSAKTAVPTTRTTYLQIFRTVIDIAREAANARTYGAPAGAERKRLQKEALVTHKRKLNSELLFGVASQNLTGGPNSKPIRTTPGLLNTITTNVQDAGGLVTWKLMENFSQMAFRYDSDNPRILLASPKVISAFNTFAVNRLMMKPGDTGTFGASVTEVETAHGKWLLVRDWMLQDGVSGQNGFAASAISIDLDQITYLYQDGPEGSFDTRLETDIVQDGSSRLVDQYYTVGGFRIKKEKNHAILFNATDYAG